MKSFKVLSVHRFLIKLCLKHISVDGSVSLQCSRQMSDTHRDKGKKLKLMMRRVCEIDVTSYNWSRRQKKIDIETEKVQRSTRQKKSKKI